MVFIQGANDLPSDLDSHKHRKVHIMRASINCSQHHRKVHYKQKLPAKRFIMGTLRSARLFDAPAIIFILTLSELSFMNQNTYLLIKVVPA